jgi:hypothetical protein
MMKKRDMNAIFREYVGRLDGHEFGLGAFLEQFPNEDFVPVYEVHENRLYVYGRDEFLSTLSERSREIYGDTYRVRADGEVALFVRDAEKRLLISGNVSLPPRQRG